MIAIMSLQIKALATCALLLLDWTIVAALSVGARPRPLIRNIKHLSKSTQRSFRYMSVKSGNKGHAPCRRDLVALKTSRMPAPMDSESRARPPAKQARVVVRRAKEADYEAVAQIRAVIIPVGMSGATGFLGDKVVIDDPQEAKQRVLMAKVADLISGEATALIALERGRVVGTVDCSLQDADTIPTGRYARPQKTPRQMFISNLFVLPEYRRQGIARKLVVEAEALAKRERAQAICLEVARRNSPARDLYFSCGFEEAERTISTENGLGSALLKSLGMGKRYMIKRVR